MFTQKKKLDRINVRSGNGGRVLQNPPGVMQDDKPEQIKHELIQYSVRTINNSQVSRKTYPRKMHALYEKTSLYESDSAIFGAD